MAITKIINDNEENLKEALVSGISGDAVKEVLNDITNNSNMKIPSQIKDVVSDISLMKEDIPNIKDETYKSNLIKENNMKLKSAINLGITSKEVENTLIKKVKSNNIKPIKFFINLVSKMKNKELRKQKNNNEKNYQKVYTKND